MAGSLVASGHKLIFVGLALEALYLVFLVLPFSLLQWLPLPAQDLGSMTGASGESAVRYLAFVAGVSVLSWLAYQESRRLPGRVAVPIGMGFAAVFAFTLLWVYPLDALDLFDYAMQGRILGVLGGNPYADLPISFDPDPFLASVGWKQFPSVYGPVWTYLEGAIGVVSGDNLVVALLSLKAVAALASLACAWFAYRVARRWQSPRAHTAVFLVGWNPLVVLMAGSGHNDLLMMAFLLGGIWLAASGRRARGLLLMGASTLVKVATGPILPVLVVGQLLGASRPRLHEELHWRAGGKHLDVAVPPTPCPSRQREGDATTFPWRHVGIGGKVRGRLAGVVTALAVLAVGTVLLYAPLWPGVDRFGPFMRLDLFTASPLGLLRELWVPAVGEAAASRSALLLGDVLLVAIVLIATWRARRGERAAIAAAHDALFWMVFLALTWWQPWYLVWIIGLAALDHRPWVPALSWIAGAAGLVSLFDRFYLTQSWLPVTTVEHYRHTLLLVYLGPLLFAVIAPTVVWLRSRRGVIESAQAESAGGRERLAGPQPGRQAQPARGGAPLAR